MKDIWTSSRLKAYQSCPQMEAYRYRQCLAPVGHRKALNLGSAIHRGLETGSVEPAVDDYTIAYGYPSCQEEMEDLEITVGTIQAMLGGYFDYYEPFESLKPEIQFSIPVVTPKGRKSRKYMLSGKIDGIAEIDGQTWLVEYKTAGQIDKSYFDRLYVDSQVTTYMYAAKRMGYDPVGIIYRVLKKPSIRQKQGETVEAFIERMKLDYLARPEFYFYETKLFRDQSDLANFERLLYGEITQAQYAASQCYYFRHTHACSNYGTCAYLPLCMGEKGAETLFEHREPHEELKEENNASNN